MHSCSRQGGLALRPLATKPLPQLVLAGPPPSPVDHSCFGGKCVATSLQKAIQHATHISVTVARGHLLSWCGVGVSSGMALTQGPVLHTGDFPPGDASDLFKQDTLANEEYF